MIRKAMSGVDSKWLSMVLLRSTSNSTVFGSTDFSRM